MTTIVRDRGDREDDDLTAEELAEIDAGIEEAERGSSSLRPPKL